MIVLKDVYKSFKDKDVLSDISLNIRPNECVGLVGVNGAGKTTLINIILGKIKPTSGFVSVMDNEDISGNTNILKQIGFVSADNSNLWNDMPVKYSFDNCAGMYEIPKKIYNERLEELCAMMKTKGIFEKRVYELSLGERIKSEIIYAVLPKPKLLLLDEATIGIDISSRESIIDYLKRLKNKDETTVIFSSHYLNDVENFCQRVLLLDSAKLAYDGDTSELIKRYSKTTVLKIKYIGKIPDFEDLPVEKYIITNDGIEIIFDRNKITAAEIINQIKSGLNIIDIQCVPSDLESTVRQIYKERD